jgi:hypothetical protein
MFKVRISVRKPPDLGPKAPPDLGLESHRTGADEVMNSQLLEKIYG